MTNTEQLKRQLSKAPKDALHPDHGNDYEQKRYLKSKGRLRENLMRQFVDGPRGNSAAYLEGWERIFGHGE